MAKDEKRSLTPKLRFPEFRNAPEWDSRSLGLVCDLKAGEFVSASAISDEQKNDSFPCYGGNGLRGYVASFTHEGLYVLVGRQGALCGNVNLFSGKFHATEHALVATPKSGIEVGWLYYALTGLKLNRFAIGQAQPGLSVTVLNAVEMVVPATKSEQQRIADCLTSLEEVIAAQGQKVETLKAHKKGLMQQLFPREGETLPRLRFPEFRNAPEWEIMVLSHIADNLDNKRVPITEKDRTKGEVPYYGASGVVDYVEGHIFDEDLLCVSEDGANLVARTYPIAFAISGKTWVNNHAHVLRFADSATQKVVEVYLNATDLGDFITGMAQPKLNRAMLDTIPIPLPGLSEQQRIADCLSALDARIAAEADKLAALKTHKKGLMQQLFPSPERD